MCRQCDWSATGAMHSGFDRTSLMKSRLGGIRAGGFVPGIFPFLFRKLPCIATCATNETRRPSRFN